MDTLLRLMKSLANETRLEIVELVIKEGQMSLAEITTRINRPYKTTAGHLKILEKAGLLKTERLQGEVLYALNASRKRRYHQGLLDVVRERVRD